MLRLWLSLLLCPHHPLDALDWQVHLFLRVVVIKLTQIGDKWPGERQEQIQFVFHSMFFFVVVVVLISQVVFTWPAGQYLGSGSSWMWSMRTICLIQKRQRCCRDFTLLKRDTGYSSWTGVGGSPATHTQIQFTVKPKKKKKITMMATESVSKFQHSAYNPLEDID